jgi:peptide/nickel transport system permease protein
MDTFSTDETSSTPNNEIPVEISVAPITPPPGKSPNLAARIAFPRRLLFILIAFGLAMLFLNVGFRVLFSNLSRPPAGRELDWSNSLTFRHPVSEIVGQRLPNSLNLLLAAFILALTLSLIMLLVGVLAHWLEGRTGWFGSLLKGLGRLLLFPLGAGPSFVLGLVLLMIFVIQLNLLPGMGMFSPAGNPDDFSDRLRHLILPALALALMPTLLAAQSTTRRVTLPGQTGGIRLWLGGLCHLLGALLGQISGWLGALLLVELVFAWPGTGRLFYEALVRVDPPLLLGILNTWALVILIVRLVSEVFRWGARLLLGEAPAEMLPLPRQRKAARLVWVIITLLLLLVPLGLAVAGLTVSAERANETAIGERMQPPSTEHPLGTDAIGRDLLARLLRGATSLVGNAIAAALLVFILAGIGGALTGFLASRRTWKMEALADLFLLPADILLFIPAIALLGVWLTSSISNEQGGGLLLILAVALVLTPRAMRTFQALWLATPRLSRVLTAGLGALFLAAFYGAIPLILGLDFIGLGARPPAATLGGIIAEAMQRMLVENTGLWIACLAVGICALALYTAADALVGFFNSKDALLHLNE